MYSTHACFCIDQPRLVLDTTPQVNYRKMSFGRRFIELHQVMWKINAGLTEPHPFESRPPSWPTLRSGISFWARENRHIYLLGNPVACWLAFLVVLNFIIIWSFFQVRDKRGYQDRFEGSSEKEKNIGLLHFKGVPNFDRPAAIL